MQRKKILNLLILLWTTSMIFFTLNTSLSAFYVTRDHSLYSKMKTVQLSSHDCDSIPICTYDHISFPHSICSDGARGAIIAWSVMEDRYDRDIYAQKIGEDGNVQWTINGVEICTAIDLQVYPYLCSDEAGGAIIAWADKRNGTYWNVYAQRIDPLGNTLWTTNGVEIGNISVYQGLGTVPVICSDGTGGAIIAWTEQRLVEPFISEWDICGRKIDSGGNVLGTKEIEISNANDQQWDLDICSDGAGGAIIAWEDKRSGDWDIYAQRMGSDGNVQWTTNGVEICTTNGRQWSPEICSDGAGGAIITWGDDRTETFAGYDRDIYAQKIGEDGNVQWTINGVEICTAYYSQEEPILCSDGAGGAIIVWEDYRNEMGTRIRDIYTQRIDSNGIVQWTLNGVELCTATGKQCFPEICTDRRGGAIIAWDDARSGDWDIYAQRMDSDGNVQWTTNGVEICAVGSDMLVGGLYMCTDGGGGAFIAWDCCLHFNVPITNIYAYHIQSDYASQSLGEALGIFSLLGEALGIISLVIIVPPVILPPLILIFCEKYPELCPRPPKPFDHRNILAYFGACAMLSAAIWINFFPPTAIQSFLFGGFIYGIGLVISYTGLLLYKNTISLLFKRKSRRTQ